MNKSTKMFQSQFKHLEIQTKCKIDTLQFCKEFAQYHKLAVVRENLNIFQPDSSNFSAANQLKYKLLF